MDPTLLMAHLYIMGRSDAPGALKVGRSDDPARRAHDLQAGHFFTMTVVARVEHAGRHERAVHAALQDRRIQGPGVEWFRCSLGDALVAIGRVLGAAEEEEAVDAQMDEAEETLSTWSEADDILGCWLAPVEAPDEAMSAAQVRDAVSRRADVSTRLVGEAKDDAGWEEARANYHRAADGRKTSRCVYRRRGEHTLFAHVRSRSSQE